MAAPPQRHDREEAAFRSHRMLRHEPEAVFEAFARPELLARWWGPGRCHEHV